MSAEEDVQEDPIEENRLLIFRVKFAPDSENPDPYWKNVGTVVVNLAEGRGSLYLNWLPFRYMLFLKEERAARYPVKRRAKARKEEHMVTLEEAQRNSTVLVPDEDSAFKSHFIVMRDEIVPGRWYLCSFAHLDSAWSWWSIDVGKRSVP
jgi:hypothetical protein